MTPYEQAQLEYRLRKLESKTNDTGCLVWLSLWLIVFPVVWYVWSQPDCKAFFGSGVYGRLVCRG